MAFIFEGEFDLGPEGLNFTIVVDQFVPAEGSIVGTQPAVLTTIVHLFGYARKKMSRICRFCSIWFDVTVEPRFHPAPNRTEEENDDALHGDR